MSELSAFSPRQNPIVASLGTNSGASLTSQATSSQSGVISQSVLVSESRFDKNQMGNQQEVHKRPFLKTGVVLLILSGVLLGGSYLYATGKLARLFSSVIVSVRPTAKTLGINKQNTSIAEIKARVKELSGLTTEEEPQITKLIDVAEIKFQEKELLSEVKAGDYLVLFRTQGFIYRAEQDRIILEFMNKPKI